MVRNSDRNFILMTDYYKHSHSMQLPKSVKRMYSYIESRGGKWDSTIFYGLQSYIKEYLEGTVFTLADIEEADRILNAGFGKSYFPKDQWIELFNSYGGKLPLVITAVKEGKRVATRNALVTISNTDDRFPWLTQFVETSLLRGIWYPTTVATLSRNIRDLIDTYAKAQNTSTTPFHLNDFGARGSTSHESAGIAGSAHLVSFMGTDTIEGIQYAMKYYNADVCGFSVFATEHSTTTVWGEKNEVKAYEHFLNTAPDDAIISIVIDSYDTANAVKNLLGGKLKEKILARKGKVVFRPDSGDPVLMSCMVTEMLWDIFGGTERIGNDGRMYKILDPHVGIIYGDGINYDSIGNILYQLSVRHFSIDNIVFGMGGALHSKVDRDTQKFACKACMAYFDRSEEALSLDRTGYVPVQKKSNSADKASFAGAPRELYVIGAHGKTSVVVPDLPGINGHDLVFANGELVRNQTFDEVRNG